jgi:hypothetical protein
LEDLIIMRWLPPGQIQRNDVFSFAREIHAFSIIVHVTPMLPFAPGGRTLLFG